MKTYFTDIIPKIQKYSKRLDDITLLINKHWVVLNEFDQSKVIYIFRSGNNLLISNNGLVEKGTWELLGNNSILIDIKEKSFLIKQAFVDENILALKIDNSVNFALLICEDKYEGNLNSLSSITQFLENSYLENPTFSNISKTSNQTIIEIIHVKNGYNLFIGFFKEFAVKTKTGEIFNIYQKKSNSRFFINDGKDFIMFPDKKTCLEYIENQN